MESPYPGNSPLRGRGTDENPTNRFESAGYVPDPDPQPPATDDVTGEIDNPRRVPLTQILPDKTQSIITSNDSPDVPFTYSINVYRGCEHGCIYCFAQAPTNTSTSDSPRASTLKPRSW